MTVRIANAHCEFEREPLANPFGFKGGYVKELWQVAALLESKSGKTGTGLGCQSVLWSDSRVFATSSECGGNSIMCAITDKALQMANGRSFDTPVDLLEQIFPEVYEYGRRITGLPDLKETFALNALVAVDNAAWILYAREKGITRFDDLIPDEFSEPLSYRHDRVANVPVASYGMSMDKVRKLVDEDGYFMIKIKVGSPGSQQQMLEQDKKFIEEIHNAVGEVEVSYSGNGKFPYYYDANGRYESKQTLQRLLEHADKIGALDQIIVMEEPFPEEYEADVSDLGVTVVADESAHTAENVAERIEMGYGAIALKPIAKTLSMTLQMAKVAHENDVPCFCADLTVNPVMVDWNKNVAARLAPLPGLEIGLLETNGHQNYKRWPDMLSYHPMAGASWVRSQKGIFNLDESFYENSGGIFEDSAHYLSLLEAGKKST